MPQRLYLRFLCAKRAVCSWVPEFAAYFRQAIPEVRGKTEIGRPDPSFRLPRPAVLLPKIGLCSEVSNFFPALPENAALHRELKRKSQHPRQLDVVAETSKGHCRKPNNDPSLSSPHVESAMTASLRTFYRHVKQPNKETIGNAVVHPKFHLNKTRGCPPLERNPLAKRWPIAGFHFSFRTSYRSIIF